MAKYYVGTAGWSYEDWDGIVYPPGKGRGFHPLSYLADFINIVEINSTFYRPAGPAMVRSWLQKIERRQDFLLSLKLYQAFTHAREGFTRKDDTLPYRTLFEPLPDGPAKGQRIGEANLDRMIDDYYACRGWDSAGVPTEFTLRKYDLVN